MDTCDVSGHTQYTQLMTKQKEVLKAARSRRGERPKYKSRSELVHNFMIHHAVQQMQQFNTRDTTAVHSSFVPPPYPPSIAPLEELKQTFIKDLRVETHH